MKTITGLLALLALLLIVAFGSGCATSPRDTGVRAWNPLTWFSRSEAAAADRAEARLETARTAEDSARDDILRIAQRDVHQAALSLLSAPPSRPVEVASEAVDHAVANLDQALGSLSADTREAIRRQIAALLSDNATLRAEGETLRTTQRERDAQAARDLTEAARRTARAEAVADTARADLRAAYDRENALANELRAQIWQTWLSRGAAVASILFGLAMRSNFMGLQTAAGEIVGTMRAKYGVKDEDVMTITGLLDSPTSTGTQKQISAIATRVAGELLASRPATTPTTPAV
jgi:regulator of replication initiation timing